MKLYQFIILIIVLLMLAGTATYIILTDDSIESNAQNNTVNEVIQK